MTEQITKSLRDSAVTRWTALILLSLTMFVAYMFVDVLAPLKSLLETQKGWSSSNFGAVGGSEFFLNVFVFFLIFAGIILDKVGVRYAALIAATLMVVGASVKLYAISDMFTVDSGLYAALDGFSLFGMIDPLPASATLACIGFAIFGCGVEMAGVTVSKGIVKWFKGKELALAMGVEMAIARLGVFAVFRLSPYLADGVNITLPVAVCTLLLLVGFISFAIYFIYDKRLEATENVELEKEDPFHFSDLKTIFTSTTFLVVAGLCVLFYSGIFPFQKFASDMLSSRLEITAMEASALFSYFPIGAMALTPLLGAFLDNKGKGATMLMCGAILMTVCHIIFALTPEAMFTKPLAFGAIILLGISFSLVPASLWPSVPKLVDNKVLGSAYSVIFWIQNVGLMIVPLVIGGALDTSNPGVSNNLKHLSAEVESLKQYRLTYDTLYTDLAAQTERYEGSTKEVAMGTVVLAEGLQTTFHKAMDEMHLVYRNKEKRNALLNEMENAIDHFNAEIAMISNANVNDTTVMAITGATVVNLATPEITGLLKDVQKSAENIKSIEGSTVYNYRSPMLIFACFGVIAFLLAFILKVLDRKKGYGLELPNKKS